MRDIKFRAWDSVISNMAHFDIYNAAGRVLPEFPLMQFTGLTDKNGVDIYESDLLSNGSGRICEAKWHPVAGCWDAEPVVCAGDSGGFKCNLWGGWVEVIGNIHENPDLLGGES